MNQLTSGLIDKELCAWLQDMGVATYSPNANYRRNAMWPCFIGVIPEQWEAPCLLVNIYNDVRSGAVSGADDMSPQVYVQVKVRGDRNPVRTAEKAEVIFQTLHDRELFNMRGVNVLLSRRVVKAPIDVDQNGRFIHSDSYKFTLNPEGE